MATKVFKRGGFIIVDRSGTESPIPIASFDYQIIGTTSVQLRDVSEGASYSDTVANIQNQAGTPVGIASVVAAYFSTLVEQGNSNNPSQQELTDPAAVVITDWEVIAFACSGAITVTIDSNAIIYPYTLGSSVILGAELSASSVSLNDITFNGTGTALITIKQ